MLQIVQRLVSDLIPYARNARTHSDAQVAQIAGSIREFGWTNPCLIDENNGLIAGHGRVLAARKLGMKDVPAIVLSGLTEPQKRALILADNKLALNAAWDDDMLRNELQELQGLDFDLSLTGFSDMELAGLLDANPGLTDPDDAPDVQPDEITVLGDVWLLGRHRLVCGDSTDAATVERALNGVKPHLMVTDPPYGVEYNAGWRNEAMPEKNDPKRWRDGAGRATGAVLNDDNADWSEAWALFPGDVAYVWHGALHTSEMLDSLVASGLEGRALIIWAKQQFVISRGHYHNQHEPCWYVVRKSATGHWHGDRKQTTLWQIDKPRKSETGHSTQKPVECMRRPIENNSSPGQAIYEPFSGSGTTIIAAEMTGRACHAIELSPQYVDVAVRRWQAFTGFEATLESNGETFNTAEARTRPASMAAD